MLQIAFYLTQQEKRFFYPSYKKKGYIIQINISIFFTLNHVNESCTVGHIMRVLIINGLELSPNYLNSSFLNKLFFKKKKAKTKKP